MQTFAGIPGYQNLASSRITQVGTKEQMLTYVISWIRALIFWILTNTLFIEFFGSSRRLQLNQNSLWCLFYFLF
jgi:hypothetical protein